MRITIDTDDKGKVNIDTGDTGDKGNEKPGLFQSTADVPVIDAGPAPVQELQRLQKVSTAGEGAGLAASASAQDREAQLPLNPLRAGAAAAYQDPANLRKKAAESEGTSATQRPSVAQQPATAQQPSITTIDGGAAQVPARKELPSAATPEQQPAKGAKREKRR